MNDAELRQLALDAVDGKVFGSWQVTEPQMVGMVFPVLMLMPSEQLKKFQTNYVHVYEYLDKANPMAVNGMPTFMSVRGLTAQDWDSMSSYARELLAQRDAFLKGTDE